MPISARTSWRIEIRAYDKASERSFALSSHEFNTGIDGALITDTDRAKVREIMEHASAELQRFLEHKEFGG